VDKILEQFDFNAFVLAIIGGPSGSGKNFLEAAVCKDEAETYNKMMQTTTRKIRNGEKFGKEYFYITKDMMKKMRSILLVNSENAGKEYGTLPYFDFSRINTVIADINGYHDYKEKTDIQKMDFKVLFQSIIGLDYVENAERMEERKGNRDITEYRRIHKVCDVVLDNNSDNYLSTLEFSAAIKENLTIDTNFFKSISFRGALNIIKNGKIFVPCNKEQECDRHILTIEDVNNILRFVLFWYFNYTVPKNFELGKTVEDLKDFLKGLMELIFGAGKDWRVYKTPFSTELMHETNSFSFKTIDLHNDFKDNIMNTRLMPYIPLFINDEYMIFVTTKVL